MTSRRHRRRAGAAATSVAALAAVLTLSACGNDSTPAPGASGAPEVFPADQVADLVAAVPQETVKDLPAARLAEGLVPPTNRWFSGLVFGETSMPVFPYPLAVQLTEDGVSFGAPVVTTGEVTIGGPFRADVVLGLGADEQVVTAYDTASVTVTQRADGEDLASTVIAQGWPFVAVTAARDLTVDLGTTVTEGDDGVWTVDVEGRTYGFVTDGSVSGAGDAVDLGGGDHLTWFAVADGGDVADYAAAAAAPITGTSLAYGVDGGSATTSIGYSTDGDTLVALLPHQVAGLQGSPECGLGTFPSVLGELEVCRLETLTWTVPTLEPSGALDLSGLSADEKADLAEQVRADAAADEPFSADTYFGGKSLYRVVNLYEVALQVGADDVAAELRERLVEAIDTWTQPDGCEERGERCFVYDPAGMGMVGLVPSFGSEEFNDHHFHYGYFLYAAGVLGSEDPELAERWAPVMDLLAADIASSGGNGYFPDLRVFDVYGGHSWASGTSPFGDGNNQESSSEAVSAWNGLALWAQASEHAALETQARWMLSAEAASALAYWTDFPLDDPLYEGFDHTVTSLVWGGKRDYATWFSAEPSAMLGILVLPMSPVAGYLAENPDRIRLNLEDSAPDGYDVMFGDFLLMYAALQGGDEAREALELARELPDERIDDGNTRSYLEAFILAQATA